jgi:hypothetical protein
MQDLEIAKKRLIEKGLTLSVVKDRMIIYESTTHGISGFLKAIEEFGDRLPEASVADRVVGKAIAFLCVYARVENVYATILSKTARSLLEENGMRIEWDELVENVLDRNVSGTCPFENLSSEMVDPQEAYKKLKALQDSLKHCG